jgi:hypothetical protein
MRTPLRRTCNAASEHKGAKHQLAKGDGHLHDSGRCTQVAAHRTQRKVRDCGAHLVREADQHASGEKPPAMLFLGAGGRLFESSFDAYNGGTLAFRIRSTSAIAWGF